MDTTARDTRTRREKLLAMAAQTSSPNEAEVARSLLERMPAPRTLSREDILSAPDLRVNVGSRRVFVASMHATVIVDEDDPAWSSDFDWDGVE